MELRLSFGVIAGVMLLSNFLLRKITFLKKTLTPTAVLAGFILLLIRELHIIRIDTDFLEKVTYHAIALGFIAMTLRMPKNEGESASGRLIGLKSGAVIIGSYLIPGIVGLMITVALASTILPDMFLAAGILLPMGYGQGTGRPTNVGSTYEQLGFVGRTVIRAVARRGGLLCALHGGRRLSGILKSAEKSSSSSTIRFPGSVSSTPSW
jgi:ESS family glutamate:Na+ symporter